MQRTTQDSQQECELRYPRIYVILEACADSAYLRVVFCAVDSGYIKSSFCMAFAYSEVSTKIAEIDTVLADKSGISYAGHGQIYEISFKLLAEFRFILSNYIFTSGGSGAQVVRKGVSTPLKSKAPVRAAALPHCASDFNEERVRRIVKVISVRAEPFNGSGTAAAARDNLINPNGVRENNDVELEITAHTVRVPANFENKVACIVGKELRKAVMPIFAEIDAIVALVKECAFKLVAVSRKFTTRVHVETEKLVRRIVKVSSVRSEEPFNGSGTIAEGPITTRGGRTSVVLSWRKVS